MTAPISPDLPPQDHRTNTDRPRGSGSAITQEQINALADRVYGLLLRDLKYEHERERVAFRKPRFLRRGW